MIITGSGIHLFQLLALRGAVKLEAKGLARRGRSATAIAKERFKVKGNRDKVLTAIEAEIKKAEANLKLGDIQ